MIRGLAAAIAFGFLTPGGTVQAAGGSFVCERSPTVEVRKQVGGSFAFQNIVNEYRVRWDASEARRQCENYAAGRPHEISCMNGRRDWSKILDSVPDEYFGQSNESLASSYEAELQQGNGYEDALKYCRDIGAID